MVKVKCEICDQEVDKRGLKNHMLKHEKEANEQKETVEEKEEITEEPEDLNESPEDETDSKNLIPLIPRTIAAVLGLMVFALMWILTPQKSKQATNSQNQTQRQKGRRF